MILWKRAALPVFSVWLIPFVVSFIVFPLKQSNAPLYLALPAFAFGAARPAQP